MKQTVSQISFTQEETGAIQDARTFILREFKSKRVNALDKAHLGVVLCALNSALNKIEEATETEVLYPLDRLLTNTEALAWMAERNIHPSRAIVQVERAGSFYMRIPA